MEQTIQVTVCGGGNLAHFTAAVLGSNPNLRVNVFTRRPNEWAKQIVATPIKGCLWESRGEIVGKLNIISDDPQKVSQGTNVFIVCGPAHIHPVLLEKITPYVEKNAYVGTCYAQGGFDMAANYTLGERIKSDNLTIFGLQFVPAITQIVKYGNSCRIIGPKSQLFAASSPIDRCQEVCSLMEKMYTIPVAPVPNFLTLTLTPSNQIIHPARVYGIFKDWDGKTPFKEGTIPLLYEDLDQFSADEMQVLDDEIQATKKAIVEKYPNIDLSYLIPLKERIINQYGEQVKDKSTLKTVFNTNLGYSTVKVPVVQVEGGVILNLNGRFFWEDIPYGLCILKNIANMVGVKTPGFDKMIEFHQKFMPGKEYIKNGELNPEFINETGTPLRFGIKNIEELLKISNFKSN